MSKRERFLLLAALLIIGALSGCGSSPTGPTSPVTYSFKEQGFSIRFPKNWEIKEGYRLGPDISLVVTATSPLDSPTDEFRERVSVIVEELPSSLRLEEYAVRVPLSLLVFKFPDYREHNPIRWEEEIIPTSKYVAARHFYYYYEEIPGRVDISRGLVSTIVILTNGNRGYAIIYNRCKITAFPNMFDEIVKSFRFE